MNAFQGGKFASIKPNQIETSAMLEEQDGNSIDSGISSMPSNSSSFTRMASIDMMMKMDLTAKSDTLIDENAQNGFDVIKAMVTSEKNPIARHPLRPRINGTTSSIDSKTLFESPVSRKRSAVRNAGSFDFQSTDQTIDQKENMSCHSKKLKLDEPQGTCVEEPIQKARKRSLEMVKLQEKRAKMSSDTGCISLDKISEMDDEVFNLSDNESPNTSMYSMESARKQAVTSTTFASAMHSARSPQLSPNLEVYYSLPAVKEPQKASNAFRSISPATLANEIRRLGDEFRYATEYEGGHVKTAINIQDEEEIGKMFFPKESGKIPIFYCEFSQKRGPEMALKLRSIDRRRNMVSYPNVDYKEIYLLDRGYRNLWLDGSFKDICEPQSYTPMDHKEHRSKLKLSRSHKLRSSRAISLRELDREARPASRRLLLVNDGPEIISGSVPTDPGLSTRTESVVLTPDMEVGSRHHAESIPTLLELDSSFEYLD